MASVTPEQSRGWSPERNSEVKIRDCGPTSATSKCARVRLTRIVRDDPPGQGRSPANRPTAQGPPAGPTVWGGADALGHPDRFGEQHGAPNRRKQTDGNK